MPTRIRLQRQGKKGSPYYHIVIADSRAPRDGRYIERVGAYDPNQNPAFIEIDQQKTAEWLRKGAQPSDTVRAILSYKGVLYLNHLQRGVDKGLFTQDDADKRFDAWMKEKESKLQAKRDELAGSADAATKVILEAEKKKAAEMAAAIVAKQSEMAAEATRVAEEAAAAKAGTDAEDAGSAEAPSDKDAPGEAVAEAADTSDAPAEEVKAEAKGEKKESASAEALSDKEAPAESASAEKATEDKEVKAEAKSEDAEEKSESADEKASEEEDKKEEKA